MRKLFVSLSFGVLACALGACAEDVGGKPPTLPGTLAAPARELLEVTWRLVDLAGVPAREGFDASVPDLALHAAGDQAVGNTGVNRYSGPYALDGAKLDFGPLASTRRAGPSELMDQEQAFLAALDACASWAIESGELVLRSTEGAELARLRR